MNNELEQMSYDALIERSMNALQHKSQFHCDNWKLDEASWSVDQDEGTIIFHAPDNIVAMAPVQIVGTYDQNQGSWMWGWANSSIKKSLTKDALTVQAYGERYSNVLLTEHVSEMDENEAWQLAALACELNSQQGVYRGVAGSTLIFMTFGEVSLHQEN
ncbi:DUF6882 domain-containing protein [Xenorhabdus hominickii]|uniref:Uncharacterized protein n=1 Tax=Xenorhabdus hominickii TaxID=351679 RepID=A0A2G0Q2X7_XENHO|nr:DUF6882 domain-containing protein [Xenorhabdus hominickii]AOM39788.1 hypothetical protein A9255_03870 [Xenorhabdus hominickii]PHM53566.1 hypothetical protein Xhom_03565 [Xenorhabdus hominickii]